MLPFLEYTVHDDVGSIFIPATRMALLPNMILSVVSALSPIHQAFLRSSGLKGLLIFNQLVEDGAVPLCVEAAVAVTQHESNAQIAITDNTASQKAQLIPFTMPPPYEEVSKCGAYNIVFQISPVVISHSAMVARGIESPLGVLVGYTVPLVRYHFDVSVEEVGSHDPSEPDHAFAFIDEKNMNIKEIYLSGCESVTTIRHSFLARLSTMVKVDISPLQHVTSIGDYFMYQCDSLDVEKGVDLSPFGNVRTIGDYFLQHCSAKTINISSMVNLLSIGTGFLSGCRKPQEIQTAPALARLLAIPSDFLLGCKNLTSIDTTPFRNVTTIGGFFMGECPLLATIDLEPFENVTTIGLKFLFRCSGLRQIDVSLLKRVTSVGKDFLKGCAALHRGSRDMYCSVEELPDGVAPIGSGAGSGQVSLKSALRIWRNGS